MLPQLFKANTEEEKRGGCAIKETLKAANT